MLKNFEFQKINQMYRSLFSTLICLFISVLCKAQQIPDNMITPVCDNQSISVGAPGNTGIYNLTIPCNTGQPLSPFMDFYYLKILSGTTFAFTITPVGQDDYDFGAWKNPNWSNIAATPAANKRGSQNDPFQTNVFTMGLSLTAPDLCETGGSTGLPEPGMVRYFDVVAGDEIFIAIDRWSQTSQGYSITFGGNAILDCTVLGNSYGKCDVDESNTEQFVAADFLPDLNTDYPGNNFKFYYNQTDAEANNTNQVVFPLTVNYNGGAATNLFVRVETASGGFVRILKLFLYVNKLPQLLTDTVDLPIQCNDGNNQSVFDLTQSESSFINNPGDYTFKYYITQASANIGGNDNIPNPASYQSGNGSVYVRITKAPLDGNDEGCFIIGKINLKVSEFNVPEQTLSFDGICDNDGDGFVIVDLTENITDIVSIPADYQISYHLSQTDADNGTNPIATPTAYSIAAPATVTVFIRIKSLTDQCFSVSKLVYNTVGRPVLNNLTAVSLCDDAQTGTISYDLTQFEGQIVNTPADYNISYHSSQTDAQNGINPINNPAAFPIPVNSTITIFIRVEKDGCFNIGSVDITITSNPLLNPDLEVGPLCDDDGDGFVIVDLTTNENYFIANPQDYQISYHNNLNDAQNDANPIVNPTSFSIPAGGTIIIYIRVKTTSGDCYTIRTISYTTIERPVLNDIDDIVLCVDQQGNSYNYDLTQLNSQLINNSQNYTISYYQSQSDAETAQNPIQNPTAFPVPMNLSTTTSVFVRVEISGCSAVKEVKFWINSNPLVNVLPNQLFCTNQQTGTLFYDLTQHQNQWVSNPAYYIFEYYPTLADLQNGTNLIPVPVVYEIPVGVATTIFVKIIFISTTCYSSTELTLVPGSTATLNQNLQILLCDENFDGIFVYNLTTLNSQLIADTTGLTFAYFLSQQDALNYQNQIPQTQWTNFQFGNLPQKIWIVATTTDQCRSVPVFVNFEKGEGIDLNVTSVGPVGYCEGDTIDLTVYETVFTDEAVSFSYHSSLNDAQNNLNPIVNTTSYYPDGNNSVFVRIEMDGRCSEIVEIKFNQNPTPDIELNQTFVELCPDDTFIAEAGSTDPNPTFEWFQNDILIGTGSEFEISQYGNYTVVVTGQLGCTNHENLQVVAPPSPHINGFEIGPDYIIVFASAGGGNGTLEYSLDQIFWQNNPRFDHLNPGETYTVFVRQGGCMVESYEITLLFVTNFISPNDDGINDTWVVRGIEVSPQATLKIFDRYGKIFVDINFNGNYIWTGKYMGANVPSGDYWYIMDVPENGLIKERKFVGHVSVRNQ